jgi:hypothetical protein
VPDRTVASDVAHVGDHEQVSTDYGDLHAVPQIVLVFAKCAAQFDRSRRSA